MSDTVKTSLAQEQEALLNALDAVLSPLLELCLAKSIPIQTLEEKMRCVMVEEAKKKIKQSTPEKSLRITSRISSMTGITRREVDRILAMQPPAKVSTHTATAQLFTKWLTHPDYVDSLHKPRSLPRLGDTPSFETLARSITQDLPPRSLLDDLIRLHLVETNPTTDEVWVSKDAFVPKADWPTLMHYFADNVGDHLHAVKQNVLNQDAHFEQALFVDELTHSALQQAKQLVADQWQHLFQQLAPKLHALCEQSALEQLTQGHPTQHTLRIGYYAFHAQAPLADTTEQPHPNNAPPKQP